jgi:hypothetical protein
VTAPTKPEPRLELTLRLRGANGEPPQLRQLKGIMDCTYPGIDRWLKAQVAELLEEP